MAQREVSVVEDQEPKRAGRPSAFTQEIADEICERIASGETLIEICQDESMPTSRAVNRWLLTYDKDHPLIEEYDGFRLAYARARVAMGDRYFDEIKQIADDTRNDTIETEHGPRPNTEWIQRSRLKVDARRFMAGKLRPEMYGEKLAISQTISGDLNINMRFTQMTDEELRIEIDRQLLALGKHVSTIVNTPIDVEAQQVEVSDVVDVTEVNKAMGDIDNKPAKHKAKGK